MQTCNKLLTLLALCLLGISTAASAHHEHGYYQPEPVTLLVNFQISGSADPTTGAFYTVGGPGYAPPIIYPNGEVSSALLPARKVAKLEGAKITFSDSPEADIVHFTCLPGSCTMKFKDGSVLVSNAGVDLHGRAINMWGPVVNSPDFDPDNGIYPIRIMGCGGLQEVAGEGRLAGMVGSVCFNGVLNFNKYDPSVLTGSSKCTITMHTPMQPPSP
jgi:hypothetical protein